MYNIKIGLCTTQPDFLARLKEFESPTFRLGGGRSILLSYWRMDDLNIVAEKICCVNADFGIFRLRGAYTGG